jgi:hypothetical protein
MEYIRIWSLMFKETQPLRDFMVDTQGICSTSTMALSPLWFNASLQFQGGGHCKRASFPFRHNEGDIGIYGINLFFLRYFPWIIAVLRYWKSCSTRYLQFWTQKLRLLTKFACGITVLNTPLHNIYPLIMGAISSYNLASLSGTLGKWGCPIPIW